MPNWCYNTVQFDCDAMAMKKLERLFGRMAQREQQENRGQQPTFVHEGDGWLFAIRWEDGTLYYETKWSPNIGVMRQIADHFGVGFTLEYEELDMQVFGRADYQSGALTNVELDDSDFEKCGYDEETRTYPFEGRNYDTDYDILEILLDRKQQRLVNEKSRSYEADR